MQPSLFSAGWYRVAEQHPRLRAEVRVRRQHVRDERWYLVVSAVSGRRLRLNESAYQFIARCDGHRSVQEVWDELCEQLGDAASTQDEVIRTLNQLESYDLLVYDTAPDAQQMVRRRDERARRRVQGFVNPFALRIPLGDPSAPLRRLHGLSRLMFNRVTLWVWLAATGAAALAAASEWQALSSNAVTNMGTPRYLLLAWFSFPFIKVLHELGHALAVRRWGGEVHEIGFTLFVLVPAPYVDASAAAAFPFRYQRVAVGAAGIMVEIAVAAAALAVWMNVQPGLVRDLAFVTMFIASVSTLIFNGNPLLSFDAYHILCDALDLTNLAPRSRAWWAGLVQRAFAGRAAPARMPVARGEGKWLLFYAPLSFACRILIAGLIVLWLGGHSTVLGAIGALFLGVILILKPLLTTLHRAFETIPLGRARWRARFITSLAAAGMFAAVCVVPMPFHTVATAVVWPPEHARVRPEIEGFVVEVPAGNGEIVTAGQVLLVLEDPVLFVERSRLTSRLEQLQANRFSTLLMGSEQVRNAEEEILRVENELQRIEAKIDHLNVRARAHGTLVLSNQRDLPGTFLRQGSTIGYVLEKAKVEVRAVVPEYDATLVREATHGAEVRFAEGGGAMVAQVVRNNAAATYDLPSAALGDQGGGPYATDPSDKTGLRSRTPIVLIDVDVPAKDLERVGGRAWVRFDHGAQPIATRWYRRMRQLMLQHFNPTS